MPQDVRDSQRQLCCALRPRLKKTRAASGLPACPQDSCGLVRQDSCGTVVVVRGLAQNVWVLQDSIKSTFRDGRPLQTLVQDLMCGKADPMTTESLILNVAVARIGRGLCHGSLHKAGLLVSSRSDFTSEYIMWCRVCHIQMGHFPLIQACIPSFLPLPSFHPPSFLHSFI